MNRNRVLVTGGHGYVGSVLCPELAKKHKLTVIDKGFFGYHFAGRNIRTIKEDIMNITEDSWDNILQEVHTVIHLAGISTEPTAQINPRKTDLVNHVATVELANRAKKNGVRKFIFASSASIYFDYNTPLDPPRYKETDDVNPISAYSLSKRAAEIGLSELDSPEFLVNIFRKGTLYGVSPRQRFDLVLNSFVKSAVTKYVIYVHCNGVIYRPMIDIRDVVCAYITAVETDNLPFIMNLNTSNWNLLVLAQFVREWLDEHYHIDARVVVEPVGIARNYLADNTSYLANFDPQFIDLGESIYQIYSKVVLTPGVDTDIFYNDQIYSKEWKS